MREIKKLGLVGLGLMGGSVMLALRNSGIKVFGHDKNETLLSGLKIKYPEVEFFYDPQDLIDICDCIIICLNPADELAFVEKYSDRFKKGTVISDISGVKGDICTRIQKLMTADVSFIPSHPMAGRESFGFNMATEDLFRGCNYIICKYRGINESAVKSFAGLVEKLNPGKIIYCDIETHDSKISYTSQLPHILALSYVNTMGEREIMDFTAGSFHDVSRVANINSGMWAELFIQNKDNLCAEIKNMEQNMQALRELIKQEKFQELKEAMDTISGKLREAK